MLKQPAIRVDLRNPRCPDVLPLQVVAVFPIPTLGRVVAARAVRSLGRKFWAGSFTAVRIENG